jgi:ABC-type nitrate/sulfonate/bicarbonate transport system ATPase subunit
VRLEVAIARKAFTNAAGERQDVLADFNFALGAGEVGVFVGPSGCGKSTMLKIVAGLDYDYQGHVAGPAGARIGMVFQEPRLLPWRSWMTTSGLPRRRSTTKNSPSYSRFWS